MLAFDKEQEGQRARVASYFDAYNVAQIETFTQQSDRARNELSMYYQQWLRTNNLLASARALKEQAAGSETAASTALALQMLQLQMVNDANGGTPATGAGLQLQVDWATQIDANELRNQVDAAVTTLTSQLASLEQKITESSEALLSGDNFVGLNATMPLDSALVQAIAEAYPTLSQSGVFSNTELVDATASFVAAGQAQAAQYLNLVDNGVLPSDESLTAPLGQTIASLEDELRNLQRQLEVEQERSKQISRARDTAWESVTALDNKRTELQLARAAANSEVRLSSSAVPVDEPVARLSLALSLALAGIGGLMFGVALAFVLELTGVRPLRMARTTPAAAAA
jgi:hypothetical protein